MWTNQEPARLSECVESLVAALPRAVPSSPVLRNRQFADELDNCITLNVRDSVSMQHVTRVVVRQVPWSGWWTPDDSQIVACGDSPLAVPVAAIDRDQGSRWAVSAPRYAREEMTISAHADRDLWLSPGGSITVMAPDVDLRCDARLQLRRADMASRPIGMSAQRWMAMRSRAIDGEFTMGVTPGGRVVWEGVPCHDYNVNLELRDGTIIASSPVSVTPGTMSNVALFMPAGFALPARNCIVIRLLETHSPEEAGVARGVYLSTESRSAFWNSPSPGEWVPMQKGERGFKSDRLLMAPGVYEAVVAPLGYRTQVRVSDEPEQYVDLLFPQNAVVNVSIVDAESGRCVEGRIDLQGVPGGWSWVAGMDMLVAPGRHRIWARTDDVLYGLARVDVDLLSGLNDPVVVHVVRIGGVAVTLTENGKGLPWDESWTTRCESAESRESEVGYMGDGILAVKSDGYYKVVVEDLDGYEPMQPVEVFVRQGEWVRVAIPVTRRRSR